MMRIHLCDPDAVASAFILVKSVAGYRQLTSDSLLLQTDPEAVYDIPRGTEGDRARNCAIVGGSDALLIAVPCATRISATKT